jgi:tetratricopeptide (TPR) repeat protein
MDSEDYADAVNKFKLAYEIDISELSAQAWEGAGNAYLGWANTLFSDGDIPEAAVKYGIVLTTYSDTEAALHLPAEAFEPLVVYGQGALESGDFTTAADTFEIALSLAEEGQEELKASAYLWWGQSLHGQELYLEAIHAFRQAEETTADSALLAFIQESEQASIYGISQLTNTLGQLIIYTALEDTVPSESASAESTKGSRRCFFFAAGELCISFSDLEIAYLALGIDEEEARFLVYQEDEGRVKIPDEIQATRPGHFRYAAYVVHELIDVSTCTYYYQGKPAAYLTRFQQQYTVYIYDTRTGEFIAEKVFLGTNPESCPRYRSFSVASENFYGSLPAMGYIYAWFEEYVK